MPAPTQKSLLDTVPKQLLIGGLWRDATGGNTLAVEDPATGRTLTHVADATAGPRRPPASAARSCAPHTSGSPSGRTSSPC
jgi:succinate-semialdehyde dehydrogenase/glutarate-semialdehyde dehydrogenase